jgi:hypothetical protein
MIPPIASLAELKTFLTSLPMPKEGYLRVFRGQNGNFGKLLSTAHRSEKPVAGRDLWGYYTMHLAENLKIQTGDKVNSLDLLVFWAHAISQHYGPGTDFLDVTHSLETALWFAFNKFTRFEIKAVSGQGEGLNKQDTFTFHELVRYDRWPDNGWLYVLDLPKSNDIFGRVHGNVIDILDGAPAIFKKSGRIKAQEACLAFCDRKVNGGNLWSMLVCDPIEMKPELADSPDSAITTRVLFPSPKDDEWYHRFLQVPYSYSGFAETGNLTAKKTIPVEMYTEKLDLNDSYFTDLMGAILTITPLLTYPDYPVKDQQEKDELAAAIPIMMIYPLQFNCAAVSTGDWHEGILWNNLFISPEKDKDHSSNELLYNLFFEFSPAELASWYEIDQLGAADSWKRSIWFRAYRNKVIKASLIVQSFPSYESTILESTISFDAQKSKLLSHSISGGVGLVSDNDILSKVLFIAMAIIGDLGSGVRLKPLPVCSTVTGKDTIFLIAGTEQSVYLKKSSFIPFSSKNYYSAYNLETDIPYKQVPECLEHGFTDQIKWDGLFCDIPMEILYAKFPYPIPSLKLAK